jgi:hypothetical protein
LRFVAGLRCPIFLYYGSEEPEFRSAAQRFVIAADACHKAASAKEERGDHMSSVPPGILDSIANFHAVVDGDQRTVSKGKQ